MKIEIGGGSRTMPDWVNVDQRDGGEKLSPTTTLPCEDGKAEVVYSSHCFEHLDDATVSRLLSEAHRVLGPEGELVLCLPDYDRVLAAWKARDAAYLHPARWGCMDVIQTWKDFHVPVCPETIASFIFCGWWNERYGDEWGKRHVQLQRAYHGPVTLVKDLEPFTPHSLAATLKSKIPPEAAGINHQNAWSRAELGALLQEHGFQPISWDQQVQPKVPILTLGRHAPISMYVQARKA